jgi:hypothetical protein
MVDGSLAVDRYAADPTHPLPSRHIASFGDLGSGRIKNGRPMLVRIKLLSLGAGFRGRDLDRDGPGCAHSR